MPAFGKSLFGNFQLSLEQAHASVLQLEQALFQKYVARKKKPWTSSHGASMGPDVLNIYALFQLVMPFVQE